MKTIHDFNQINHFFFQTETCLGRRSMTSLVAGYTNQVL